MRLPSWVHILLRSLWGDRLRSHKIYVRSYGEWFRDKDIYNSEYLPAPANSIKPTFNLQHSALHALTSRNKHNMSFLIESSALSYRAVQEQYQLSNPPRSKPTASFLPINANQLFPIPRQTHVWLPQDGNQSNTVSTPALLYSTLYLVSKQQPCKLYWSFHSRQLSDATLRSIKQSLGH